MGEVARWTNLDAALADLAAACALVTKRDTWSVNGLPKVIEEIERVVLVPRLGPLVEGSIGRTRLLAVVERYVATNGEDGTAALLRRLHEAAVAAQMGGSVGDTGVQAAPQPSLSFDDLRRLADLSPAALATVLRASPALRTALLEAGYDVALAAADHAELRPAWQGGLFAEDPSVDRAVRPLLDSLWERAGRRMSLQQWSRVRDVTVFLVQVTRDLRDDRPLFALRAEDGGKGQVAGEGDLQAHLMDRLRWRFGRDAVWERSRVAGGRSD